MSVNTYIIPGYNGSVRVRAEASFDGTFSYINQNDIVEFGYDFTWDDGYENTEEGFELIQKDATEDTYVLCGYLVPDGDNHHAFIAIGTYYKFADPYSETGWNANASGAYNFNGTVNYTGEQSYTYDGLGTPSYFNTIPLLAAGPYASDAPDYYFNFPFPIFDSLDHLKEYVISDGEVQDGILNSTTAYDLNDTDYYFIYMQYGSGTLYNGQMTPSGTGAWKSLKFAANAVPVMYFDENFNLVLEASKIVASKAVTGPGYVLDNIPESQWTLNELEYSGPFYGTVPAKINYTGELPENGTYTYAWQLNTNVYIFKDVDDAREAQETGDYSKSGNGYELDKGNTHQPIKTGTAEGNTIFGSGYGLSPFVTSYICSKNDVLNVANAFYTNDSTLLDNIKQGLELFGANPYEAICGLSWFPFDLNTVATAQAQSWIYFGSYKYEPGGLSIDKVINMKSSGYVNAGSIYVAPIYNSYRDLEPYCEMQIYLPYHGWEKLDIAKYYKKTVNIRYYIDIFTNTYACALVVNNQIADVFPGNIGVTLPICGSNLSEYANSMLRAVLGTAGGTAGGAMTGAMIGGGIPGAIVGAAAGGFAGLAKGTFEMAQKGKPKDHLMVKGSFSGASSSYMPQYVIIRFDIHNMIVPGNLTALYGRPSSSGGKVSQFSGFLKCDTIKLNTGRMTDAEIAETLSILREGVFI